MDKRLQAHKRTLKTVKETLDKIENLVVSGKCCTASAIEKKTGIVKSTVSGRLSDLERIGKIYKTDDKKGKDSVYAPTPKNQIKRKAGLYAKMRVNAMLKTLKENYFDALPTELKNYFDQQDA